MCRKGFILIVILMLVLMFGISAADPFDWDMRGLLGVTADSVKFAWCID
jgi:hypothetical protein